ncbi:YhcH/YjgK/YiaL family protein [Chryseobacterium populi]|uniref:YhcH/YjgK/YiaL family protein n=1 Tax=Chryseobacterium populi TaxID=1144316 RepID=J2KP99_9FLAO|nr:YhcH/YjgK/YiaL family protein [Chryseobacterium populi]EJL74903.1 hypothetical protein, YhcH/YjgK/YiaL family [Chryseobacterium populi]
MIFDRIEKINEYGLDLNFIVDDLKQKKFVKGKYNIDEPNFFGIDLEYITKDSKEGIWEAHRKYLDIHIILEGKEIIEIADINEAESTKEYEDDYELFNSIAQHKIYLRPGYFLILFPHEVHKTSVKTDEAIAVKKKVFKKLL